MKTTSTKFKLVFKNIAAIFIGFAIAFAVAEVVLQIYNPFPATVRGNKIVLSANGRTIFTNDKNPKIAKEVLATTNSIGFRGPNPPPPQSFSNYLTIIAVGGSTTKCLYNSDSVTWPGLVQKDLSTSFENVWVNNAGLPGHTTYGHLILMNDYIIKLKPKIVLFLFGVNDVGKNKQYENFSLYAEDGTDMFIKNIKTFLYKSEVIGLCINFSRYLEARKEDLPHDLDFNLATATHLEISAIEKKKIIEEHSLMISGFEKRVEDLAKSCITNNILPVFITQPVLYADTTDITSGINLASIKVGKYNGQVSWELLQLYNDITRKVAVKNKLLVIDLANELPHDSRYYYDLIHFSDDGNRKIAEIIDAQLTPYLKEKGF